MVTLYIGVIEIKIIRYPHIKARTMKLITKETDKSLGSWEWADSGADNLKPLCKRPASALKASASAMPSASFTWMTRLDFLN